MKSVLFGTLCAFIFTFASTTTHAALVSKLGGQVVYDTDLDITWLANVNLAKTNNFGVSVNNGNIDAPGVANWSPANAWIDGLNAYNGTGWLGFNNWRLPSTLLADPSCSDFTNSGTSFGYNCTGSELGHLFYDEFGATAGTSVFSSGNPAELEKFTNMSAMLDWGTAINFWSGTVDSNYNAYHFWFGSGRQDWDSVGGQHRGHMWPVIDGDIGAVPIPPALWLFGSGLLGLVGIARRNAT